MSATHKLIDLALLTQYNTNGVIPIKNGLVATTERVDNIEGYLLDEVEYTLAAENWEETEEGSGIYMYSLEETYPASTYDVDVYLDDDSAQAVQRDCFVDAVLYGSATSNVIYCGNEAKVPSIDLPVILKVVTKTNAESS
jgi:hypothetical protein